MTFSDDFSEMRLVCANVRVPRYNGTHLVGNILFDEYTDELFVYNFTLRTGDKLSWGNTALITYGIKPEEDCVFVKDFGQFTGTTQMLIDAGLAEAGLITVIERVTVPRTDWAFYKVRINL